MKVVYNPRSYENQEGRRVYVTEVVCDSVQFLEPKGANQRQSGNDNQSYNQNNNEFQNYGQDFGGNQQQGQKAPSNQQSNNQQSSNPFANANGPIDISDDDLPF